MHHGIIENRSESQLTVVPMVAGESWAVAVETTFVKARAKNKHNILVMLVSYFPGSSVK